MMGKLFLTLSVVFFVLWIITTFGAQIPLLSKLGHLPGDIHVVRPNFSFHIPIVSSIIVSVVLTLLLKLFTRIF